VRVGIVLPQGWTGEYAGWDAGEAWARTLELARRAEMLGFESAWLYDHVHTTPEPRDEITFEAFTSLAAIAASTSRIRLGQIVTCNGFRNPALVAKMASTMDVLSGGRMELGIGAGWKREEWLAYGYEFPSTRRRLAMLEDSLAVITAMFGPGRATAGGDYAHVDGAINLPKPLQRPRLPIVVGGNGRDVTWRLAARYADELNVDAMPPDEIAEARADLAERCREVGRDPGSLPVSAHIWWEHLDAAPSRAGLLEEYRRAGVSRVMTLVRRAVIDPAELDAFAADARAAGASLVPASAPPPDSSPPSARPALAAPRSATPVGALD
jgi:F420-dependent oxidoreductase-like protein